MVAHIEKVRAVRCTPEFWKSLGINQETRFTKRQNWACHSGYESSPDGWVLVVDADELLYIRDRSPGAILAEFSEDVRSVLVLPAERVLLDGNETRGFFRQKMEPEQVSKIFGAFAPALSRNHGLVGHSIGKSFLRTGLKNIWMKQHGVTAPHPGRDLIVDRVIGQPEGAYLLHYFSRGYDDWRRKLEYRLRHVGFRPRLRDLLRAALASDDPCALPDIYGRLHHIDQRQYGELERYRLLVKPDIDLDRIIARYF